MPERPKNRALCHGYILIVLLIVIAIPIAVVLDPKEEDPTERGCETLLSVARKTYSGQIDYIRRGLTTATAACLLTDFLNALLVHAEKTGTRKFPVADTCISRSFLSTLQFKNGSLHTSAQLEKEIIETDISVPLLSHDQFPGDTSEGIGEEEWNRTATYLLHTQDARINMSLLTIPDELTIRCDPYTETTCAEFSRFANPLNLSVSAETLTTQMTSLVSQLISRGVNATQATQLLLHNTAYMYLGTRCHKEGAAKLGVPLSFVGEYGRLAGLLTEGSTVGEEREQGLSYKQVKKCLSEQVDVLSGYASAGSVPEKIIAVSGKLEEFVLRLQRSEVEHGLFETTSRDVCKRWASTMLRGACKYTMRAGWIARRRMRWVGRQEHGGPISADAAACAAALEERERRVAAPVVSREEGMCEPGWRYVSGMKEEEEGEIANCCAEICVEGAVGLGSMAAREFMKGCCKNCNQLDCARDEVVEGRERERMQQFTLDVPPYGTAKGLAQRIML